ncbi:MAG: hypothetical protein U0103_29965, partial [Candidatus Obscuribacterales bacterium]
VRRGCMQAAPTPGVRLLERQLRRLSCENTLNRASRPTHSEDGLMRAYPARKSESHNTCL